MTSRLPMMGGRYDPKVAALPWRKLAALNAELEHDAGTMAVRAPPSFDRRPTPRRRATHSRRSSTAKDATDDGESPAWARELLEHVTALEAKLAEVQAAVTAKTPAGPRAYTRSEAAKLLGVSISTLKARIASGTVRTVQIGGVGHRRVPESEIRRLLAPPPPTRKVRAEPLTPRAAHAAEPPHDAQDEADKLRAWTREMLKRTPSPRA